MRLVEDYLQLRSTFAQMKEYEPFPASMAQVADALYCSQRNAKLIIIKMVDQMWVRFVPGRGRGNTSELTFLKSGDEVLLDGAKMSVGIGEVESALKLISEHGTGTEIRRQFAEWLSLYFGYQADIQPEQCWESLKLPVYRPIHTLDPARVVYAFDGNLVSQIFDRLIEYDSQDGRFIPGIAHFWRSNEDKTVWTFYLRKGVIFHHGRELDAADVEFSLLRLRSSPVAWLVQQIEEVKVLSRYGIEIRLKAPNHLLLWYLSGGTASIVPADVYRDYPDREPLIPVGTGAYRVTKRTPGICQLSAYDRYFQGRPLLDVVEIIYVPEDCGDLLQSEEQELLVVHTGESQETPVLGQWNEQKMISGTCLLTFNLRKASLLQNPALRKALTLLIDRSRMARELGPPLVAPSESFRLKEAPADRDRNFDPEEGLKLLRESGYCGKPLRLYTYSRHIRDAHWLKQEYGKYGIEIEVCLVSWDDMLKSEHVERADFIIFEAVSAQGIISLMENYLSDNSFLRMHLGKDLEAFVDDEMAKVLGSDEAESENEVIQRLEPLETKLRENYAIMFLTYKVIGSMYHPSLQNVTIQSHGWVDFKKLWFQNY
ncbi:HTH-type transcriptional regulator SgrR [compost metagenome]